MRAAGKESPRPWTPYEADQTKRELTKILERLERLEGRSYYRNAPAPVREGIDTARRALQRASRVVRT